jgi:hypothetical protein
MKKPRRVLFDHVSRKYLARVLTAPNVVSVWTLSLPTVMDPTAQAIASSRVDFPHPFSPTKKVTGDENSRVDKLWITGTVNGNTAGQARDLSTVTDRRWIPKGRVM